jgi:transcriptional regulator with XRE-family HTH domain
VNGTTIGATLREVRSERGLTQEELAERAGVSKDIIAKLEQGRRTTARVTTYARLANALDIHLSDLLGNRSRIEQRDTGGILAVRDVLLSLDDLPGIDPADDDGAPTPLSALSAQVKHGWALYWGGRFGDLAHLLPGLIGEARITERSAGSAACQPLAQAYQLAADLMVHVGNDDLAAIGAERAIAAAYRGDDPLQHATLAGTASWVLLHQARLADAERVARTAAEKIEMPLSKASAAHVTVWGALLLSAAAPAAAAARADEVGEYIGLSRAAAARFQEDRHDYWVSFGPSQVAMQAVHTFSVLRRPAEALRAVDGVHRSDLLHISYGAHQLDVAQAHLDAHHWDEATAALWEAHQVSPEWFRHQGPARAMVRDVVDHEVRKLPDRLRQLRDTVGAV